MSQAYEVEYGTMAADAPALERQAFIRRTYLHVAGALGVFAGLCALLQVVVPVEVIQVLFLGPFGWLMVILAVIIGQVLAEKMASPNNPIGVQYFGLGLYIVLEAAFFWPILWYAGHRFPAVAGEMPIIYQAALLTLMLAGGLTIGAFVSGKDYSFLRPLISIGLLVALGIALIALFGGLHLGIFFPLLMIGLMSAAILYETSQVMYHYQTDQHVGASLAIFAYITTLFWFVLRLLMASRD
jgi:uncharacterized protein